MTMKEILIAGKLTVSEGGGGGDDSVLNAILDASIAGHYENDVITSIGPGKFRDCKNLTSVSFPNVTTLGGANLFNNCTALESIYFPNVGPKVAGYAFLGCSALKMAVFPKGQDIEMSVFESCTALKVVDILGGFVRAVAFRKSGIETLVIRKADSICQLAGTNAFDNTPFASAGSGGTLYVPQSLISSYQSANNWSTILGYANNEIKAIEGSIYENAYADGTPIA